MRFRSIQVLDNHNALRARGIDFMTYKLDTGIIEKIRSTITLVFPDEEKLYFRTPSDLLETTFDRQYRITSITAKGDSVMLKLEEVEPSDVPFDGDK